MIKSKDRNCASKRELSLMAGSEDPNALNPKATSTYNGPELRRT